MQHGLIVLMAATVAAASTGLASDGATQPSGDDVVRARLVSETPGIRLGSDVTWIGVAFEIRPGWHLYWNGRNDSGAAPEIKLTLPEGFVAGKALWPAPKRLVLGGEILDHVYEDRLTVLIPIQAKLDPTQAIREARIEAELTWMVCEDVCLLGGATVSTTLPVESASGKPPRSADAKLFEQARQRLPQPLPAEGMPFTLEWADGAAVIVAPGAERVSFYPGNDAAGFESFLRDGEAKGDRLVLKRNPFTDGPVCLAGVLEITRPKPAPPSIFALRAEPNGAPAVGNQGGR